MARDQPSLDFPRAAVDARHVADLAALFVDLGAPPPVRLFLPGGSTQLLFSLPPRQWEKNEVQFCMLAMLQFLPLFSSTLERRPRCGLSCRKQVSSSFFNSPRGRAWIAW